MGLTISLLSFGWVEVARNKIAGLGNVIENVAVRSLSFNPENANMTLRSVSFKRSNSDINQTLNSPTKTIYKGSPRFKNWQVEKLEDDTKSKNHAVPQQIPAMCPPPMPRSELDAAALKLQKVYKSYRTRRNLADCAVVVEELWWKALDFASLKRSSISFYVGAKPETAVSRWSRARTRAAKVGKGLSKSDKAQKLALQHWLEAIDPRHRYGHNLRFYYDVWFKSESTQPFFFWLDIGDGREVNLEKCPRNTLQNQYIKYLGPNEREAYEVIVENGKLVYKKSGAPVNTAEGSKWIFVLSTLRALYVGKKKKGKFQHSSFLAGGAIMAAGRLVVKEGTLKVIWPYSGHYLPTEENFKEFIKYLADNEVDLKDVKRCGIGRDENLSFKKLDYEPIKSEEKEKDAEEDQIAAGEGAESDNEEEEDQIAAGEGAESDNEEEGPAKEPPRDRFNSKLNTNKSLSVKLGERLPCNWTTGAGPRIGCVRDYPSSLQFKALEHVNLSPKLIPPPSGNKGPIPSPRPSPGVRLSPRLAYMCIHSPPTISLALPKPKRR